VRLVNTASLSLQPGHQSRWGRYPLLVVAVVLSFGCGDGASGEALASAGAEDSAAERQAAEGSVPGGSSAEDDGEQNGLMPTSPGASSGGASSSCGGEERAVPSDAQSFSGLTARITDQLGEPASPPVQVCSFDLCLFGDALADGSVEFDQSYDVIGPAFKVGLGFDFAAFAYRLPAVADHALGDVTALRLPASGTGSSIEPGATVVSEGVLLTLGPDTVVKVDALTYSSGPAQNFRAVVSSEFSHPAIDSSLGIEVVVGATPVATTFCPPATLSVPNVKEWTAGTEVELLVHGVKLTQKFAPYGKFHPRGIGKVDPSGNTIEFADQVEVLSTFGLRRVEP